MQQIAVILNDKNWLAWKRSIQKLALDYGEAGKLIISGAVIKFKMPEADDCYLKTDAEKEYPLSIDEYEHLEIATMAAFVAAQPAPIGAGDTLVYDAEINRVGALYEWMYAHTPPGGAGGNLITAQGLVIMNMDIRDVRKRKFDFKEKSAALLSEILKRISSGTAEAIESMPEYALATRDSNLAAMWALIEAKCGGTGALSTALTLMQLIQLKQGSRTFEATVVEFTELKSALISRPLDIEFVMSCLLLSCINHQPFGNKPLEILCMDPLPRTDHIISSLATMKTAGAFLGKPSTVSAAFTAESKPKKHGKKGDTATKADDVKGPPAGEKSTYDRPRVCFGCGAKGEKFHYIKECPIPFPPCHLCNNSNHSAAFCADAKRFYEWRDRNRPKKQKKSAEVNQVMSSVVERYAYVTTGEELQLLVEDLDTVTERHFDPFYDNFLCMGTESDDCCYSEECDREALVYMGRRDQKDDALHDTEMHIDTGSQETIVTNAAHVDAPRKMQRAVHVSGIAGGRKLVATMEGDLSCLDTLGIKAIVLPGSSINLLSLGQVVDAGDEPGCSFRGDRHYMEILDSDGNVLLDAQRNHKGFWGFDMRPSNREVNYRRASVERHFSREQIARAKEARLLHSLLGHPSDSALVTAVDNHALAGTNVTSADIRNAAALLGPCEACIMGKRRNPSMHPSMAPPATYPGQHLFGDIVPFDGVSIDGDKGMWLCVCEFTGLLTCITLKNKAVPQLLKAMRQTIAIYNARGFKVQQITTDAERCLKGTAIEMAKIGVLITFTIPYEHQKRIERYVQTINATKRTIRATLPYILPTALTGELTTHAVSLRNVCGNSVSGITSPYQLMTGDVPDLKSIAAFPFGSPCIAALPNKGSVRMDRHHGITLGWDTGTPGSVRVYFHHAKFVATRNRRDVALIAAIPASWGWTPQAAARTSCPEEASGLNDDVVRAQHNENNAVQGDTNLTDAPLPVPAAPSTQPEMPPVDDIFAKPAPEMQDAGLPEERQADDDLEANIELSQPEPPIDTSPIQAEEVAATRLADTTPPLSFKFTRLQWNSGTARAQSDEREDEASAFVSISAALKGPHREDVEAALLQELATYEEYEAATPIYWKEIPSDEWANVLDSHTFVKYKTDKLTGEYSSTKARAVIRGDQQPENTYTDKASTMVNIILVFILIKIMTALNLECRAYDIKGAYLSTKRAHPSNLYMRLSKEMTALWTKRHPEDEDKIKNGFLYMKVEKCIYGLKDSGYEFNLHLNRFLTNLGYTQSEHDQCFFIIRKDRSNFAYVVTWVDDILVIGLGSPFAALEAAMAENFAGYTKQEGNTITYLGITIERDRQKRESLVGQCASITELIHRHGMDDAKPADLPYRGNLLECDTDSPPCDKILFLMILMALMYIARMTRPDILFVLTFLASRCECPTEQDMAKLKHVLRYLKRTQKAKRTFSGQSLELTVFADASYGIHPDSKGHTGVVISMGPDPIHHSSVKQKCVALSSTEAEIVALVEAAKYARWLEDIFGDLELPSPTPITVYQDNQSTIRMMQVSQMSFKKTKHMTIKTNYTRALIEDGKLVLEYLPTASMLADLHTKPLGYAAFMRFTTSFMLYQI